VKDPRAEQSVLTICIFLITGQLTDGICTPIVGIMADRIGSRKKWHIIGKFVNYQILYH
jgi:hypothetical protein